MDYNNLTHRIIGCTMTVHNALGPGFWEVVYQRALAIELQKQGLSYVREKSTDIYYEGIRVGHGRVDFFCGRKYYPRTESSGKIRRCSSRTNDELL